VVNITYGSFHMTCAPVRELFSLLMLVQHSHKPLIHCASISKAIGPIYKKKSWAILGFRSILCSKNQTTKTGWHNFVKIGPLWMIFRWMHWHLIVHWLHLKSLIWV